MAAKTSRRIIAQTIATKLLAEPDRTQDWMRLAAAYLVEARQTERAGQLLQDIAREIERQSGLLLAQVTSAHELSPALLQEIADSLAQKTGAERVQLDAQVDPTLLSGYIARTPDYEVNTTAQYKLKQLKSLEA